ncbi:MAG: glycosyltransferase [Calothrix sp. MO_192.B10]|nr:glycosyltransferase [Calothrix sp. MO_192.B10]
MKEKLLLVNPVILRELNGQFGLDDQTCQDFTRWTENFDQVVFACITLPEHILNKSDASTAGTNWQAIADLPCAHKVELIPLPWAYTMQNFVRTYAATRKLLKEKIEECKYLCFNIWGLIGGWGAIACLEAIKQGRPYAVWTDAVEYEVIHRTLSSLPWKRRIKEFLTLPLLKPYHQYLISKSELGLFQGQDCYLEFSPFSKHPYCVYNIHTQKSDQIDISSLNRKIDSLLSGSTLQICYAGRAAEMKGPLDWLRSLHHIHTLGINFQATWMGYGPLLSKMKSLAKDLGICDRVNLVGFVSDRHQLLQTIRESHIFLFCHKTPESPRCLVESLVSGCPIVGYSSAYPLGLVSEDGGGVFVPMNNWQQLAEQVVELNADRNRLSELTRCAALSGRHFDEETVFQRRSQLIKQYIK